MWDTAGSIEWTGKNIPSPRISRLAEWPRHHAHDFRLCLWRREQERCLNQSSAKMTNYCSEKGLQASDCNLGVLSNYLLSSWQELEETLGSVSLGVLFRTDLAPTIVHVDVDLAAIHCAGSLNSLRAMAAVAAAAAAAEDASQTLGQEVHSQTHSSPERLSPVVHESDPAPEPAVHKPDLAVARAPKSRQHSR